MVLRGFDLWRHRSVVRLNPLVSMLPLDDISTAPAVAVIDLDSTVRSSPETKSHGRAAVGPPNC
jgi:hypothetical protein